MCPLFLCEYCPHVSRWLICLFSLQFYYLSLGIFGNVLLAAHGNCVLSDFNLRPLSSKCLCFRKNLLSISYGFITVAHRGSVQVPRVRRYFLKIVDKSLMNIVNKIGYSIGPSFYTHCWVLKENAFFDINFSVFHC